MGVVGLVVTAGTAASATSISPGLLVALVVPEGDTCAPLARVSGFAGCGVLVAILDSAWPETGGCGGFTVSALATLLGAEADAEALDGVTVTDPGVWLEPTTVGFTGCAGGEVEAVTVPLALACVVAGFAPCAAC